LPIHIVWLELIIHPTALLAFQELDTDVRLKPVRERERVGRFFNASQWIVVGSVGAAVTFVVLSGYERGLGGLNAEHARAVALVTLVIASATLTATLSRLRTRTAWAIVAASVTSAVILVQIPLLADLLHVEPLHVDDWAVAAAAGFVPAAVASLFNWRRPNPPHKRDA
jgi:Ca2+-transporting ATPase